MLTQNDLQAIEKIFEKKFDSRLSGIESRMIFLESKLSKKIDTLDKKIEFLDNKTSRSFKAVDKKLDVIINYFDHQDIDIRKRLNRIELHLGLMPLNS